MNLHVVIAVVMATKTNFGYVTTTVTREFVDMADNEFGVYLPIYFGDIMMAVLVSAHRCEQVESLP